jgi:formamidopyrimidine-DNA glycosylase
MPELPEVESVAIAVRSSEPPVIGSRIASVELNWPGVVDGLPAEDFALIITGRVLSSVSRHGKYLFFCLDKEDAPVYMAMHLRMTGICYINSSAEPPRKHNRLSLHLENGMAVRFDDPRKFGRVWLVNNTASVISGLGPDALSVVHDDFVERIRHGSRQLKPLLLDQSFVAGIGNIYADESLFLAGLNPLQKSSLLGDDQVEALYSSVKTVLEEAVKNSGANIDGVFKAGNYQVRVYGREGKPCVRCGDEIVKIRVGQRGTHYCPSCQPLIP